MDNTPWKADRSLVRGCLQRDPRAWDELVRKYRRLVYSIPLSLRLSPDQADDVFQRVFLKLISSLEALRDVERLAAWLATTARRESWEVARRANRYQALDSSPDQASAAPPPEDPSLAVEREHALVQALERIGEPCRGLLTALYLEDPTPSYDEIGRRLDRPVGSLGPTRARCLAKLRKLYLEEGGGPPDPPKRPAVVSSGRRLPPQDG
jgi:RNA polymerase sigma factor (sigma-70 family)